MNIKDLFSKAENGMLTLEQFEEAAKEAGAKFADLSDGKYVSKSKYDADLQAKEHEMETLNAQLENLNTTIATRDTDLEGLKKQLEDAGQSSAKLADVNLQLTSLQDKYASDTKAYQDKLNQQAYEFAVREFANGKKFTSNAAKRDFTAAMIAKGLQMEDGKLMGGEDFVTIYSQDNADAFVVDNPTPAPAPTPAPTIVAPTPGANGGNPDTGFNFHFTGVN